MPVFEVFWLLEQNPEDGVSFWLALQDPVTARKVKKKIFFMVIKN